MSDEAAGGFFLADWELEICFSLAFFTIFPVVVVVVGGFLGLVRAAGLSTWKTGGGWKSWDETDEEEDGLWFVGTGFNSWDSDAITASLVFKFRHKQYLIMSRERYSFDVKLLFF